MTGLRWSSNPSLVRSWRRGGHESAAARQQPPTAPVSDEGPSQELPMLSRLTRLPRLRAVNRRAAALTLAFLGIAGFGVASAAQLSLSSAPLGAGSVIVATCQSAGTINVAFTTAWNTTTAPNAYRVTEVRLSNVNANCNGKAYQLQMLQGASPNQVALGSGLSGTLSVSGGNATITVTGTQPLAADVTGVALVIQG